MRKPGDALHRARVADPVAEAPAGIRHEAQPRVEDQLEQEPQPEHRHRHAQERGEAAQVVDQRVAADGGDHADRDPQEDATGAGRLTASSTVWGRNCLISLITGRVVTGEVPRSPRRRSGHVVEVLDRERRVQVVLARELGRRLRRGAEPLGPRPDVGDVLRHHPRQREGDEGDADQHRDQQDEPAQAEADHGDYSTGSARAPAGSPRGRTPPAGPAPPAPWASPRRIPGGRGCRTRRRSRRPARGTSPRARR